MTRLLTAAVDIWFVNLGIRISDISRSFSLFGKLDIYFYGVIIATSVMLGLTMACFVAKKTGQSEDPYLEVVIYGIISAIIGARIYYVIFAWDFYKDNPLEIFNLRAGGLAIYGGLIAAFATAYLYCRIKKYNFLLMVDTAVCGVALGQCTGRWSNFVNMEAFGGYTNNLLAMRLNIAKVNDYMISADLMDKAVNVDGVTYIQVHPTFLYESLWSLMVLTILLLTVRKKKFNGQIFLEYLAGYGCGRFWIEGLRTDQLKLFGTGLAASQMLSAVLVLTSAVLLYMGFKKAAGKKIAVQTPVGEAEKETSEE